MNINRVKEAHLAIEKVREILSLEAIENTQKVKAKIHVLPNMDWISSYLHMMYYNSMYKAMHDSWEIFGEGLRKLNRLAIIAYKKESFKQFVERKNEREDQIQYLKKHFYVVRQAEYFKDQEVASQEDTSSTQHLLASPV